MSFPLALQPVSQQKAEQLSLQFLIARINEERGAFRNVTEGKLQEEVIREARNIEEDVDEVEEPEPVQDVESRRKEVYAAKNEMLKYIGQANNEALMALDFISLLLTKEVPRAETTMSPALKNTVPKSTLDFDRSAASQPTKAQEDNDKNVAIGWSLTSLNSAADKLLQGAQRLEKEMEKEAKYWEQILSVSEKGWSTCRMPRERHTVGVRFGFPEAGPQFAARGLAALRPDGNGVIILDQGLTDGAKMLRVRIKQGQENVSVSQVAALRISEDGLEALIEQARDSLFDEELFHEITREARTLLSYGVFFADGTINLPLTRALEKAAGHRENPDEQQKIVIELVQRTSMRAHMPDKNHGEADDIALALRMLMSDLYRQRFKKRSQPPKPLTDEKYFVAISNILRPLTQYLAHFDYMTRLETTTANIHRVLGKAGIDTPRPEVRLIAELFSLASKSTSIAAPLVDALKDELRGTISIGLPNDGHYTISVITSFRNGTILSLKRDGLIASDANDRTITSRNMLEFERELFKVLRCRIASWAASKSQLWSLDARKHELVTTTSIEPTTVNLVLQGPKLALMRGQDCVALWRTDSVTPHKTLLQVLEELATTTQA